MIIGVSALAGGGEVKIIAGEPRPDWCNRCMSSSAVRLYFYVLREDEGAEPVYVYQVGLSYACMVCNPEAFGMGDDDEPWGDAGALV